MSTDNLKYISKLSGARVLVIGGSSGIGFSVCEALIEHGASDVYISSSNPKRVEDAISRLKTTYPTLTSKTELHGHSANLGDDTTLEANIKGLLDTVTDSGANKLNHIVYTAGDAIATMKLSDITMDAVRKAGAVRFFGPLMLGKFAPQYMTSGPSSSIVLTTGSVSERPMPDWTVVNSYATGAQGMTRGLALDLKPLRVNLISPGGVDTELWHGFPEEQRKALLKTMGDTVPTGTVGKPEDVALAYIYAMTDHNITGTMISTNSGTLLMSNH